MKFLYLCSDHGIPILGAKGASVHVRSFANALMDRGHTVRVVCAKRGQGNESGRLSITEITPRADPAAAAEGATRLGLEIPSLSPEQESLPNARELLAAELRKLAYNAALEKALERIVEDEKPDVLYERYALLSNAGTVVAQKYGLPLLLEVNAPLILERQATYGIILQESAQRLEDQVLNLSDAVIAVSAPLRQYVIERGVPPQRVTVLANGVDLDIFNPARATVARASGRLQELHLPPDLARRIVVGFVGSLKAWHGVDILLEAFAHARQVEPRLLLLIVGEGPQLEALKSQARAEGLSDQVIFTGAVPHQLIPDYIGNMDITVAPYRRQGRFYFSSLKILEYMAMAKPVIASRQGQIAELIANEKSGLLCEAESIEPLTQALIRLAHDPEQRRRLGHNAAETAETCYSWLNVVDRVAGLAQSLASPFRSSLSLEESARVSSDSRRLL